METTTINGREYQVQIVPGNFLKAREAAIANGWDGNSYALTGKRGAVYLGMRSAKTGEYVISATFGGKSF